MKGAKSRDNTTQRMNCLPSPTLCCRTKVNPGRIGCPGATANLLIAAAGAGVLSYPYATEQQGILLITGLTCGFAMVNAFTLSIVGAAAHRAGAVDGLPSYEATIGHWLGIGWQRFAAGSVICGSIGALSGFTVIICDLLSPLLLAAAGGPACSENDSGECSDILRFMSQRWFIALAFGALLLPLTSGPSLGGLSHSSVLAAASVAAVTLVLGMHVGAVDEPRASSGGRGTFDWADARSFWGVVRGIPIIVFALGNHLQLVPLWDDMVGRAVRRSRTRRQRDGAEAAPTMELEVAAAADEGSIASLCSTPDDTMCAEEDVRAGYTSLTWAMVAAAGLCTLLYTVTGSLGYAAFGSDVCGDVLRNMGAPGTPAVACIDGDTAPGQQPDGTGGALAAWNVVAKALMAIHVALAYPVILFPCKMTLLTAYEHWAGTANASTGARVATGQTSSFAARLGAAAALTALCGGLAVGAPGVQVVFGLAGATVSVSQIHLLPAAILWQWAADTDAASRRVDGIMHRGDETPLIHSSGAVREVPGRMQLAPVQRLCGCGEGPAVLRAQAVVLVAIGLFVGVLGTGITVWQTWF